MNIQQLQEQITAWFVSPDHLGEVDHQIHILSFPDPMAWVWTQWDGALLPDGSRYALCTIVHATEYSQKSYASCAVFSNSQWNQVCRVEHAHLLSPQALQTVASITSLKAKEIEASPFLEAFTHDVQLARSTALQVLSLPHFPAQIEQEDRPK